MAIEPHNTKILSKRRNQTADSSFKTTTIDKHNINAKNAAKDGEKGNYNIQN